MRYFGLLVLLSVAACAPWGPDTHFRNPATGEVVAACGPYPGLATAVEGAEKGCAQAYEEKGWVRAPN